MDQGDAAGPDAARPRRPGPRQDGEALSRRRRRFTTSTRGTSTPSSRSTSCCTASYPHFLEYEEQIVALFADYTLRKQERNLVDYDDLLLFWATMLEASPDARGADRRTVRPRAGRRVPGHQPAAGAHPSRHVRGPSQAHRGRRRRAEHLLVPRRALPKHPRLSHGSSPAPPSSPSPRTTAPPQPILDAHQHADLARRGAVHQGSLDDARRAARSPGS